MIDYTMFEYDQVAPGQYDAIIAKVDVISGPNGPKLVLDINVEDPQTLESKMLKSWIIPQISTKFPLFGQLVALVGGDATKAGTFDEQSLVGVHAIVDVVHNTGKDGKTYVNLVSIKKK